MDEKQVREKAVKNMHKYFFLSLSLRNMNMKRNGMSCNCIYLTFLLSFYLLVSLSGTKSENAHAKFENIDRKTFGFRSS